MLGSLFSSILGENEEGVWAGWTLMKPLFLPILSSRTIHHSIVPIHPPQAPCPPWGIISPITGEKREGIQSPITMVLTSMIQSSPLWCVPIIRWRLLASFITHSSWDNLIEFHQCTVTYQVSGNEGDEWRDIITKALFTPLWKKYLFLSLSLRTGSL